MTRVGTIGSVSLLALLLSACAGQSYQPAPLQTEKVFSEYTARSLDAPGLREFMNRHGYDTPTWPLPAWDRAALTLAALYFNPDLRVAEAEWQRRQAAEITAGQRANPTFNLPLEWHTDTSDGQSPWLLGVVLDLILERPGKRAARIEQAELRSAAASLQIGQVAWQIRSQVHTAVAELMAAREKKAALQQREAIIRDVLGLLQRREELGQVAAFELSNSRLELQRLQLASTSQQTRIDTARGQLAAAIGVPAAELAAVELDLPDIDKLPAKAALPAGDIQGLALKQRYDIRHALAEYAAQEAALRLEIEKQYPDITLSPGFVFDQSDNVWQLGAAWLLPLFHRHEGQIAEAVAQRSVLQARFLQLQSRIVDHVYQARMDYLGKLETYRQAVSLAEGAADYRDRIQQQLKAGYTNRLQLLRAQQAVGEAEQAVSESRTALLRSHAALEEVLQHPVSGRDWTQRVTLQWLEQAQTVKGDTE